MRYTHGYTYTIIAIATSVNRKPALATRGLSVSYLGRPKGAESASSARRSLRALDLSSILARRELEANTRVASSARGRN